MLEVTFTTDDKTKYLITFSYKYHDDPGNRGLDDMKIERINESPSAGHRAEIMEDWNCGKLFNDACDLAYKDMESRCED